MHIGGGGGEGKWLYSPVFIQSIPRLYHVVEKKKHTHWSALSLITEDIEGEREGVGAGDLQVHTVSVCLSMASFGLKRRG